MLEIEKNNSNKKDIEADQELKQLIGDFSTLISLRGENDDQVIYQYTNWGGLKGIIESKSLWFTDYHFVNDPSEINYSVGYFGENIFPDNVLEDRYAFYYAQTNALRDKPIYIASMCARRDYLPAWRMYADDGAGFSIGFDRKKIEEGWYRPQEGRAAFESIFDDVKYVDRTAISQQEKEKFDKLISFYKKIKGDNKKVLEFRLAIRSLFPLIKNVCYQEEEEIRIACSHLCYFGNPEEHELKINYRNNHAPAFCNSIPYVEKPIELDWITEIWAGPRVNQEHAKQEIKKLLANLVSESGHSIKLEFSKLPYKNPDKWL